MKNIKEYINIIIGTTILALATTLFFEPSSLVTGGVVGLGIMLNGILNEFYNIQIPLSIFNIVFNIPLFLFAIAIMGKKFGVKSLVSAVYLSVSLYVTSFIPVGKFDLLISSIYGGLFSGVGLGLVFKSYSTTGGTDLMASLINRYKRHIPVGRLLFFIDGAIIVSGLYVFGLEKGMYAIIAVFVMTKVLDGMLEGLKFAKLVYIISDKYDELGKMILNKMHRGVTLLDGKGLYSNTRKDVLMCVVSKREVFKLKDMVSNIDDKAFVIVNDVKEVLGEGFAKVSDM